MNKIEYSHANKRMKEDEAKKREWMKTINNNNIDNTYHIALNYP